jgi:predicted RNase H-like nuclease (RuvC/YqgF family)
MINNLAVDSGIKRLIGKPRKLPAIKADGTKFTILLSLGEAYSGGIRKFIATMRAEDNNKHSKESLKSHFEQSIDKALTVATADIKTALGNEMQNLLSEIESLKSKNKVLKNKMKQLEQKERKDDKSSNQMSIDLSNVVINERLAEVGGSGAGTKPHL